MRWLLAILLCLGGFTPAVSGAAVSTTAVCGGTACCCGNDCGCAIDEGGDEAPLPDEAVSTVRSDWRPSESVAAVPVIEPPADDWQRLVAEFSLGKRLPTRATLCVWRT